MNEGEEITLELLKSTTAALFAEQRAAVHAQIDAYFDKLEAEAYLNLRIIEREIEGERWH